MAGEVLSTGLKLIKQPKVERKIPFDLYNYGEFVNSDGLYIADSSTLTNFRLNYPMMISRNFSPTIDDEIEIVFTVSSKMNTGTNKTIFGCVSDFFDNLSLELGQRTDISTIQSIWLGIPTNGTTWAKSIGFDLTCSADKFYEARVHHKDGIFTLSITDDEGFKTKSVEAQNFNIVDSRLQLGGIARSEPHAFYGTIDLTKSYITINDELFWGTK